ncbi:MAG: OsmC family protein [Actinomycetota bacterium]|nr:OsmC family protein [Actinomycetota bacterium]
MPLTTWRRAGDEIRIMRYSDQLTSQEVVLIESAEYPIEIQATGPKTGKLASSSDSLPEVEVASPPEFGGPEAVWSPEHLFVASVSSCLMTTFQAIAANSGLTFLDYSDRATGYLKRGDDRLYRIESITLRPSVVIEDESKVDRTLRLLTKAEAVCLISRSIDTTIELEPEVSVRHQVGT